MRPPKFSAVKLQASNHPPQGIAIIDAGAMAVFVMICTLLRRWARQFAKQVDAHTVEVADFTVVIKGLPEVDPIEVTKSPCVALYSSHFVDAPSSNQHGWFPRSSDESTSNHPLCQNTHSATQRSAATFPALAA
jgi:hypothetical protein